VSHMRSGKTPILMDCEFIAKGRSTILLIRLSTSGWASSFLKHAIIRLLQKSFELH
jgi:hypothetical protein